MSIDEFKAALNAAGIKANPNSSRMMGADVLKALPAGAQAAYKALGMSPDMLSSREPANAVVDFATACGKPLSTILSKHNL